MNQDLENSEKNLFTFGNSDETYNINSHTAYLETAHNNYGIYYLFSYLEIYLTIYKCNRVCHVNI